MLQFGFDVLVSLIVAGVAVWLGARVLLPYSHRITLWEAVASQVFALVVFALPAFAIGWFLYKHLVVALVLCAVVQIIVEKIVIKGLYIAKKGPSTNGKGYVLATIACAATWFIASPIAAYLSGDW